MPTTVRSARAYRALLALALGGAACGTRAEPQAPAVADGAAADAGDGVVVARWEGGQVTKGQLEAALADELRQMDVQYRVERYERLHDALDGLVEDAILDAEVARQGLPSREALLDKEVEARLGEPTEQELREEFERFLQQVPDAEFEAAKPFLKKQLLHGRRQAMQEQYVRELKERSGLSLELPFPEIPRVDVPVDEHDPTLGQAGAPLTIVQFGGYQCYYCRRVNKVVEQLVRDYDGRVRLVFKDFPLAGHARAQSAAVAAHCAGEQGRYWKMADVLLENQGRLEDEHLGDYARQLELDVAAWSSCMTRRDWERWIEEDVALGRELGVSSTPTFFFNGLMVTGAHPYDRFAALVDQELARLDQR